MVSPGQLLRKQSTHVPKAASPKISQVRDIALLFCEVLRGEVRV